METKVLPLSEFLLARIAEAEASICTCGDFDGHPGDCAYVTKAGAFALAECEAKRRVAELLGIIAADQSLPSNPLARRVLGELAVPHADHPDYREEWRP